MKDFDKFLVFLESKTFINISNLDFCTAIFNNLPEDFNFNLEKFRKIVGFKSKSIISKSFWLERGFSEEEAINKVSKSQSKKSLSKDKLRARGLSDQEIEEHFRSKFELRKQKHIDEGRLDEINKSKGNSNRWEFYLNKINPETNSLYTEEEAKLKIKNKQGKFLTKMHKSIKDGEGKYFLNTSLEYWINKTSSIEEAEAAYRDRQNTFSLEKLLLKYDKETAEKIFNERQIRWQNTLNNKSEEEIADINRRKVFKKRFSKSSFLLFSEVEIKISELFNFNCRFLYGENEFWLRNGKHIYFYDFVELNSKTIIEYHGVKFHPKKNLSDIELNNFICPISKRNGHEILEKDELKKTIAISNGYNFLELYEDDKEIFTKIINFLKENYEKHFKL